MPGTTRPSDEGASDAAAKRYEQQYAKYRRENQRAKAKRDAQRKSSRKAPTR